MKGWQTACIPDEAAFDKYSKGEEVTISVLVYPDWMKEFEGGNKVEVYFKSNTPGHPHFTGQIMKNNGVVPSVPEGGAKAISITVKRLK
jgi:hypothetical protein